MGEVTNQHVYKGISIIVPACNEEKLIGETLQAIRTGIRLWTSRQTNSAYDFIRAETAEIIVVDDGSSDHTYDAAAPWADIIVTHPRSYGKGAALNTGLRMARGSILVFLDADLGSSAASFPVIVEPVWGDQADMVIARLPKPVKLGGFGMVKRLAQLGVYQLSGFTPTAPLSGQRAVRSDVMKQIGRVGKGFGVEVGLTIDAVRLGYRIQEREVSFSHRESGRDLRGWLHRGQQFYAVGRTLWERYWYPIC
ncbi:Glycosyl transferase family 2 [Paenibacillus sp. 1_12]|uniref:glycosyltransferase family 2 protein n=1 Tax=Paenibacillus sp. 1_12 TaxID=1566278 RepID=UPI0008E4B87C|nr:glycosyltransferase family 2 protein [Paenibacillus sp. 1_12]SFK93378.1 Glycosyl transferase family 2 [Paenibacillus sp. 1_12]